MEDSHGGQMAGLQRYKLHFPLKYLRINDQQFLRTKVFGFVQTPFENIEEEYFTCCLCKEVFDFVDVITHSKSHYPLDSSDACQLCNIGFDSVQSLINHLKKHCVLIDELCEIENDDIQNSEISTEICICEYCGKTFKSEKQLRHHFKRIHETPFQFECKLCEKSFAYKCSLKRHTCVEEVKLNEKVYWQTCKCKKIFLFEDQYLKHIETCDKACRVSCKECSCGFRDQVELDLHVLAQHIRLNELNQPPGADWICEICGVHMNNISAKKHYLTHSFKEKKFKCSTCDMRFSDQVALDRHQQSHSTLRPFGCEICSLTFKRKDHLILHLENKHYISKEKRKYQCRKCNQNFTSYSYLTKHQRLHSKGISYECIICKSGFPTEHSLKVHQTRSKHDGLASKGVIVSLNSVDFVNKFRCKFCFQRYGSANSLKKHLLSHRDENILVQKELDNEENVINKPVETVHQCSICSKKYLSESSLKIHFSRTNHGPVKLKRKLNKSEVRFKCNKCSESFDSLLRLRLHKIKCKHFYKCVLCGKQFIMDFQLKNHLIKVHGGSKVDESVYMSNECQQIVQDVLKENVAEMEAPIIYFCTDCQTDFSTEDEFNNHTHDNILHISDPIENVTLLNTEELTVEKENLLSDVSVLYHCQDCLQHFLTDEDFLNHTHESLSVLQDDTVVNTLLDVPDLQIGQSNCDIFTGFDDSSFVVST